MTSIHLQHLFANLLAPFKFNPFILVLATSNFTSDNPHFEANILPKTLLYLRSQRQTTLSYFYPPTPSPLTNRFHPCTLHIFLPNSQHSLLLLTTDMSLHLYRPRFFTISTCILSTTRVPYTMSFSSTTTRIVVVPFSFPLFLHL